MNRFHLRSRVRAAFAFACCLTAVACSGAPAPSATPAAAVSTNAAQTAAPSQAATPAAAPTAVPLATFLANVEPATEPPAGAIVIEMRTEDVTPGYSPNQATASPGTIVLFFRNTDKVKERHDFSLGPAIGKVQARMDSIGGATAVTLTISDVPAGTYTFWCSVQEHYKVGMVGTLTVAP